MKENKVDSLRDDGSCTNRLRAFSRSRLVEGSTGNVIVLLYFDIDVVLFILITFTKR